jgi:hypothetical protein
MKRNFVHKLAIRCNGLLIIGKLRTFKTALVPDKKLKEMFNLQLQLLNVQARPEKQSPRAVSNSNVIATSCFC